MSDELPQMTDLDPQVALPVGEPGRPGGKRGLRPGFVRAVALLLAVGPASALIVASRLIPDSRGLGTHQQLGLPPCSMRMLFGIRCPGCGMTTSWAYFTQGEWLASAQANVAGFLLAWFSLAVTVIAVRSVVTGCPPSIRIQQVATLSGVAIMVVAFMNWGWRLMA